MISFNRRKVEIVIRGDKFDKPEVLYEYSKSMGCRTTYRTMDFEEVIINKKHIVVILVKEDWKIVGANRSRV